MNITQWETRLLNPQQAQPRQSSPEITDPGRETPGGLSQEGAKAQQGSNAPLAKLCSQRPTAAPRVPSLAPASHRCPQHPITAPRVPLLHPASHHCTQRPIAAPSIPSLHPKSHHCPQHPIAAPKVPSLHPKTHRCPPASCCCTPRGHTSCPGTFLPALMHSAPSLPREGAGGTQRPPRVSPMQSHGHGQLCCPGTQSHPRRVCPPRSPAVPSTPPMRLPCCRHNRITHATGEARSVHGKFLKLPDKSQKRDPRGREQRRGGGLDAKMRIRLQGWDVASSLCMGVLFRLGQAEGTCAQTLCSSHVPPSMPKQAREPALPALADISVAVAEVSIPVPWGLALHRLSQDVDIKQPPATTSPMAE